MKASRLLRSALLAVLAAGCASTPGGKKGVVWPNPPEKPRIRFVQAVHHTDDLDTSGWARMRRAITGGSNDPALTQPMGAAISEDGKRLYIADFMQQAVFVADFEARRLKRFAPDEPLNSAFNVALDAEENVYVSDSMAKAVHVFNRKGERLLQIGPDDFERPTGLAIDKARKLLYVVDTASRDSGKHRVLVYDLAGKRLRELGRGKGRDLAQFYFPTYVAVGSEGEVYVADSLNFRVQVYSPDGTYQKSFGEPGDGPGTFNKIKGIAQDGFGNIYVADSGHSNVQIFNRDAQLLMFFGAYASRLEYFDIPSCVAIDPKINRIYVCNEYVARINVYELINTTAADSLGRGRAPPASPPASAAPPESSPAQIERQSAP